MEFSNFDPEEFTREQVIEYTATHSGTSAAESPPSVEAALTELDDASVVEQPESSTRDTLSAGAPPKTSRQMFGVVHTPACRQAKTSSSSLET